MRSPSFWTLSRLTLCHLVAVLRLTVAPALAVALSAYVVSGTAVVLLSSSSAHLFRAREGPTLAEKALPHTASISGCQLRVEFPSLPLGEAHFPSGRLDSIL